MKYEILFKAIVHFMTIIKILPSNAKTLNFLLPLAITACAKLHVPYATPY